ncbi:hypothetical protein LSAT2_002051 [Lamellibrachia satsuma]|nr:hypothetical protein LSAT2_002051 [Lamellibrachia satsuma]
MAGDADRTAEELEQMTMNAIETAMASSEQTYEQFLQCFTHLTAEDITLPADGVLQHGNLQPIVSQVSGHIVHTEAAAMPRVITSPNVGPTDVLEEVILDEGTKMKDILVRLNGTDSRIQVDNFVDIDDSDDNDSCSSLSETSDDKDTCGTYEASFVAKTIQMSDGARHEATSEVSIPGAIAKASVSGGSAQATDYHDSDSKDRNLVEKGLASKNNLQLDCRPNPGEVEWDLADLWADRDLEGKTNIRHLDFSSKLAVSAEGDVPTEDSVCLEVSHDEVEPFQLDDDFDYDNVVLSSKYTAEEMSLRTRLRQASTADTQVGPESEKADVEAHGM